LTLAREVDEATLRAVEAQTMREAPLTSDPDVAAELLRCHGRSARAAATRWFVGVDDGVDACHATLYSDGRVAQIEEVATLEAHRNRGLARATVGAATAAALESRHELVFIVASDDDWPKELYAKHGFEPIDHAWGLALADAASG
jgi:predicted GNAT family acetyltransferase